MWQTFNVRLKNLYFILLIRGADNGLLDLIRGVSRPDQVPLSYILNCLKTLVWEPRIPTHSCSSKGHANSKTQSKFHIGPQLAVSLSLSTKMSHYLYLS